MTGLVLAPLLLWCISRAYSSMREGRELAAGSQVAARRPGGSSKLLVAIGGRLPARARSWSPPWAAGEQVAARAAAVAGLVPADVPAFRVGAALAFGAAGVAGAMTVGGVMGLACGALLVGFGLAYPDLWLRTAAARRQEQIERRAPLMLDLMAATVAAGIDLDAALRGAAVASTGPLRDELELARANIELGRTRRDELHDVAQRTGSSSLAGLAMAVSLSDRLGVPLAEALAAQARRARADRGRAVQERSATAGPKVLIVVVFVLVPAALLPLLAAVALSVAGTAGGAGW